MAPCAVCDKANSTKQCGRCKAETYCSVECQTSAWKAGHKKTCGKPAPVAVEPEEEDDKEGEVEDLTSTQAQELSPWLIPGRITFWHWPEGAFTPKQHFSAKMAMTTLATEDVGSLDMATLEDLRDPHLTSSPAAMLDPSIRMYRLLKIIRLWWLGTVQSLTPAGQEELRNRLKSIHKSTYTDDELKDPKSASDALLKRLQADVAGVLGDLVAPKVKQGWEAIGRLYVEVQSIAGMPRTAEDLRGVKDNIEFVEMLARMDARQKGGKA
ncbi:hypothetical protein BCR35DRAFT_301265 [Leucosporidium creatinivorum]|uniref:MYND-type domain-containing protein n=1 Tax=Leucosporidium creatinivorum TaxID=106004 RepID=A0A1Y2FXV7_9BASI|nr:hypothetical protein BCR35DRAFT_301265 [Leucosporidium creatinivorum]